ncbi:MAG: hypothetical protein JWM98_325, partial [Thermoleophilia bacterium]|nr:hypothetical protein [Thermoleophilia bacterium]
VTPRPGSATAPRVTCNGRRATIVGTERGEVLRGTRGRDVIAALGGNDRILGMDGADIVCAGAGNDVIVSSGDGGVGDLVSCGAGRDRLTFGLRDRLARGAACESRRRV